MMLRENDSHEGRAVERGTRAVREVGAYGAGRSTAQRRAIAAAAEGFSGAFTADDLAGRVRRDAPFVSTATVYRAIAAMASSGYLTQVGDRDGAALYARCEEPGHHHHVVCTRCGATAHTPCPLDEAGLAAAAPDGFVVTSHEVRLYGLCAACAGRGDTGAGAGGAPPTPRSDPCPCDAGRR
jgi:Fur family transcriptional regulator, ferric uptake regulator